MRSTTALNDNVVDLNALLHPGTAFEHPRDVVSHPTSQSFREARHPGFVGVRRLGDRVMPVAAGSQGTSSTRRRARSIPRNSRIITRPRWST